MNNKVQKVLEKIEENGYEAYVIGGYVRDHLLNIETTDVDICTNALPKDIIEIFEEGTSPGYGAVAFNQSGFSFEITTYRTEGGYDKRKPTDITYVDNLITDIKRRDFTINAICMSSTGEILDLLNAREDLQNRKIKAIGDVNIKLAEDPLRILRAIRFAVVLDFDIDEEIIKFINYNKELLGTLSYYRKEEELNRILASNNAEKGLKLLKELDILEVLGINYPDDIVIVNDILGIWAQMRYNEEYPFNKTSQETITAIRKILDKGIIDNLTLFNYNLYISTVAGEILGIDRSTISNLHASLPIKDINQLAINNKDILEILEVEPSPKLKIIHQDVVENILNENLLNEYEQIKKYLLSKWK